MTHAHSFPPFDKAAAGRVTLVLQGGGAMGAYQAGVYQALHEAGIEPEWVIGTSIGAVNAGLIAGNLPENRVARLREFWTRMTYDATTQFVASIAGIGPSLVSAITALNGLKPFFEPNPLAIMGSSFPLGAENAGYYSVKPLEKTLTDLIDTKVLESRLMRLTVGTANVRTSEMRYFDSRDAPLGIRNVLASASLPPAFPGVRIGEDLYWDGGILSNTPLEAVFDDNPRISGLIFSVHLFNPKGEEPDTLGKVLARQKDVQFASRSETHIARQKQMHKLRHIISELAHKLPEEARNDAEVRMMAAYGCTTHMHIVKLLAPTIGDPEIVSDTDFSPQGIKARWEAGYNDTVRVCRTAPWIGEFDPMESVIVHEAEDGQVVKEG